MRESQEPKSVRRTSIRRCSAGSGAGVALIAAVALAGCSISPVAVLTSPASSTDPAPVSVSSAPPNQAALDALADALDEEGRGSYRAVYGSVVLDTGDDTLILRTTSLPTGRLLESDAQRRHPGLAWNRVRLLSCPYPKSLLDADAGRLRSDRTWRRYPLVSAAPLPTSSGLVVTLNRTDERSLPARATLEMIFSRGLGVPVWVEFGPALEGA